MCILVGKSHKHNFKTFDIKMLCVLGYAKKIILQIFVNNSWKIHT